MAIDSATSYAVYKRETGMQFIQDGWPVDDEESKTLHEGRKGKFSYNAVIMRLLVFCKRLLCFVNKNSSKGIFIIRYTSIMILEYRNC